MLATLAGGVLSVVIAASLTVALLGRVVQGPGQPVGRGAAGHRAAARAARGLRERRPAPQSLFGTLLGGLLFFWLLEKAELYRHAHHHEGDGHGHHHHFDAQQAGRGGWSVLVGDSIHNFCDGVIIAAAFLADTRLGVVTALAIVAHEIPQEVGDYIVLLNAGFSRRKALAYNALSGLAAVAGGVLGYFVVGPWEAAVPVPAGGGLQQLHLRGGGRPAAATAATPRLRETLAQVAGSAAGLALVLLRACAMQGHAH